MSRLYQQTAANGRFLGGGGGYDLNYVRDIELRRERIRNRAAKQTEVMHSSAWHKCIFILYAIPG